MNKVKLTANVLFSGIGCQERGFENSNLFDVEVVNTSEINKEAVLSYAAIHCGLTQEMINTYTEYPSREEMIKQLKEINLGYEPEKNKYYDWDKLARRKTNDIEKYWLACKLSGNLGDISKITEMPYADLWTCSFPCTDVSVAGKMKGLSPDTSTRSSLLWENIRLLKKAKDDGTLPKYLMFENVKNLVSKKFIDDFNNLLEVLDELGFNSYWKVINSKDCGVPQNRERVFVISIRKDIDDGTYDFPKPFDTGIRLKDILDKEVDEKYYLSKDIQERFVINIEKYDSKNNIGYIPKEQIPMDKSTNDTNFNLEYSNCITSREDRGVSNRKSEGTAVLELTNNCIQEGNLCGGKWDKIYESARRYYSCDGVSPTIHTCGGGNTETKILEPVICVKEATKKGYAEVFEGDSINLEQPNSKTRRGRVGKKVAQTLTTSCNQGVIDSNINTYGRVRKLTPIECWKLMGLTEEDCANAKNIGVADSQLYKQAGNGLVTNCVSLLAEHLYKAQYDNTYKCTDENFI